MAEPNGGVEGLDGEESGRSRDDRLRQRLEAFVPDLLRRTVFAGLGAVLTSEDSIRRIANDFSLPKDVVSFLLAQAQGTKNELYRAFGSEMRRFLDGIRLDQELRRALAGMTVEIEAKVRFLPETEHARSDARSKLKIRRVRKAAERPEPEDPPPPADADAEAAT